MPATAAKLVMDKNVESTVNDIISSRALTRLHPHSFFIPIPPAVTWETYRLFPLLVFRVNLLSHETRRTMHS